MLVLTRKLSESIQINEDITITVLKIKGKSVRLGIEAPRNVRVVRGELPRFGGTDEPIEMDEDCELQEDGELVQALSSIFGDSITQTTTLNLPKKG